MLLILLLVASLEVSPQRPPNLGTQRAVGRVCAALKLSP